MPHSMLATHMLSTKEIILNILKLTSRQILPVLVLPHQYNLQENSQANRTIIQKLLSILEPLNTFEIIQIPDSSSHGVAMPVRYGTLIWERHQVDKRCTEVCSESLFEIMELKL